MSEQDRFWIGFDLGGTKMLTAAYDENFEQLSREKKRTKAIEGTKAVIERIIDNIEKVIQKSGRRQQQLAGIGIGVPGTIDLETGMVLEAPNLGWSDIELKKILSDRFDCPVILCNDVDAGLYGEYTSGAAKKAFCSVGIFPGTGVGGACVYDGLLLQGRRRTAMEVGHVQIYTGGVLDGAGNEGTLETVSSRLAIAAASAQAVFRGQAPELKKEAGTDLALIRSGILADAIKDGDEAIENIVLRAAEFLGTMIANLVHLFSPDLVVMGGGLAEAMPKYFVDAPAKIAKKRVLDSYRNTFEVVEAKLGDDAAIIGAAAWARKSLASTA